jgi:hypothetical protein
MALSRGVARAYVGGVEVGARTVEVSTAHEAATRHAAGPESHVTPFEHPDWIERAVAWVHACVPTATGAYVHERASHGRHLVRFETDADPVWLKTVHARTNEYELTLALSQWEPERCLPAFAHRVDWRAWLSRHVRGRTLGLADGCERWAETVRSMATIQAHSVARIGDLLGIRCRDYRAQVLLQRLDWLLEVIARAMAEQPSCPPQRLAERELIEIGGHARRALTTAIASGMPDALTHTDWGPHNVIIEDGGGCRLIDWAGACVAPAPVSFAWLLVKFENRWPDYLPWLPALKDAWDQPWSGAVRAATLQSMRELAPMLAMLVRACRDADLSLEAPVAHGPRKALLRSVARLMLSNGRRRSAPAP